MIQKWFSLNVVTQSNECKKNAVTVPVIKLINKQMITH